MGTKVIRVLVLSKILFLLAGGCYASTASKLPDSSLTFLPIPISNKINPIVSSDEDYRLPEGWAVAEDNDTDCRVYTDDKGGIFFERDFRDTKCSFYFKNKNLSNGNYLLKTKFSVDGNEPKILLNGDRLKQNSNIKINDGELRIDFKIEGSGKVWGNIQSMSLTKIPK